MVTLKPCKNKEEHYEVDSLCDFQQYDFSNLQEDWPSVQLSERFVTNQATIYRANSDMPGSTRGSKAFNWVTRQPIESTAAQSDEGKKLEKTIRHIETIPFTTTMLAV